MLVPDENVIEEPTPFFWKEFDDFFTANTNGPFCNKSDELRGSRTKTTHTQGMVAKIEWKPFDNPEGVQFSGIYKHGSEHAILRLSSAANLTEESQGILPAIAIKFLLTNRVSTNLLALPNMTGLDEQGQQSFDFFHRPLKSRIERFPDNGCERETVEKKLI